MSEGNPYVAKSYTEQGRDACRSAINHPDEHTNPVDLSRPRGNLAVGRAIQT